VEKDTHLRELLSSYLLVSIDRGRKGNKYMRNNICVKLFPASIGGRKNEFRMAFACASVFVGFKGIITAIVGNL
jgi:hypothetical protein